MFDFIDKKNGIRKLDELIKRTKNSEFKKNYFISIFVLSYFVNRIKIFIWNTLFNGLTIIFQNNNKNWK